MVNLDDIKNGDTLVVEGVAYVADDSDFIGLTDSVIRNRYGTTDRMLKLISHTPQPIAEPTGIGAVVKVQMRDMSTTYQYIIVNSGSSRKPWFMKGYNNLSDTWENWMAQYDVVEVLSPGVDNA
jgi:hypothetical protein